MPASSETVPEEAIQDGRPQWRVEQNREIFAPFLHAVIDLVGKETKSGSEVKKMLVGLPRLNFNEAVRSAFGATKNLTRSSWTASRIASITTSL